VPTATDLALHLDSQGYFLAPLANKGSGRLLTRLHLASQEDSRWDTIGTAADQHAVGPGHDAVNDHELISREQRQSGSCQLLFLRSCWCLSSWVLAVREASTAPPWTRLSCPASASSSRSLRIV
jgi:hypothetical protein